tara:strand:+ start:177 stop:893 length:717 start_codon:yes stop_codon:yes gene_type:complete
MNKILKLSLATLIAGTLTTSVIAGEGHSGLSIGVTASTNDFDVYGAEREKLGDGENGTYSDDISSASRSFSQDVGSLFIEYTSVQGTSFGAEYIPGSGTIGTESRTDTCGAGGDDGNKSCAGTSTAKADVENFWTFYVEPTYMVNDMIGVYARGGVSKVDVVTLEQLHTTGNYGNRSVYGGTYGLGVKAFHPLGVFLKLSAEKTEFRKFTLSSTGGEAMEINGDIDVETVKLAIGYNF